jgi:type IV pilus assembly protein PilY1
MKTYNPFRLLATICFLLLGLCSTHIVRADDTDIYVNGNNAGDEPMVMFVLDWRPNLTSTVCNSFSAGDTDATIAAACGWDATFVSFLTAADKADSAINFFELLRAVLRQTMSSLDGVKIGLMVNHDDNCSGGTTSGPSLTGCSNGAYILSGFKSIDAADTNGNKAAFHNLLASIPNPAGNASHKFQGKELYFEFFRYLTGQGIYNGHLGWQDFSNTNAANNLNGTLSDGSISLESPDYSAISWDTSIESGTDYVTPFTSSMTCTKVFVINILFQVSQQEDDSDAAITATKAAGGMNSLSLAGNSNSFNTVVNWMYKNDLADGSYGTAPNIDGNQNVISYFLTNNVNTTTNAYASAGGTGNAIDLSSDPTALANTIKNIFNQILSVSTTFVSASVPVNVFNRAEYLDDVYMALFEAEENGFPRWVGNLKKLKLQQDASQSYWYIGDVNGNPAFAADGRINYSALTFWTDETGSDVLLNFDSSKGEIAGLDGRSVNRGGAGQQVPGFLSGSVGTYNTDIGARQVFTEPLAYANGNSTALMALDATAANASTLWSYLNAAGTYSSGTTLNNTAWSTAADYASATAAEQTEALDILKWARGTDVMDEDADTNISETRPWLLADPIHSRPLTINYGITSAGYTANNPDVRIVVTGNDGFVHMFQNTDNTGAESGVENWAFIPHYAMRILERLKVDAAGSPLHPYGVDGAPVLYSYDANDDGSINAADGDKAYLYFGMRRGGRAYYALDITNPDNPKMLWSISHTDADFSELGLTFSRPQLAYMSYIDGGVTKTNQPVLVFGGGYDTNKDTRANNAIGTTDSMGNAIFIVNAEDGSLVWKAVYGAATVAVSETVFHNARLWNSIPSDVTAFDSDGNGEIDRLYVGDTGGLIFRADLADTNRLNWKLHVFASVGRHSYSGKTNDRRFFHAVDVAQTRDNIGPYDAVIVGSGDRANPMDRSIGNNIPENYYYMFKDRNIVSGTTLTDSDITFHNYVADLSNNCMQSGTCTSSVTTALENYGWKIKLEQAVGEKALSRPLTLNGAIYFTTYLPPDTASNAGSCGPAEGGGLSYAVHLADATPVYNWDLTNTTTSATGEIIELGATDRFHYAGSGIPSDVIAIRKDGNILVMSPGENVPTVHKEHATTKTYWYIEGE